jgi:hypothetical protein
MPTAFFLVRAVVAEPLREKFDAWYSNDHLPWAIKIFKCEKAWRFWSETEPGVHYAVYRFADRAAHPKSAIADFGHFKVADIG